MKRDLKLKLILIVLVLYIIIFRLFILNTFLVYSQYINAGFLIILTSICILMFGYRKDLTSDLKRKLFINILICITICSIISCLFGIFTGFLSNSYSLKLGRIVNNVTGPLFIIIFEELLRYIIVSTNKDKKWLIILFTGILLYLIVYKH